MRTLSTTTIITTAAVSDEVDNSNNNDQQRSYHSSKNLNYNKVILMFDLLFVVVVGWLTTSLS
jgi:hypothetical protein